MIQEQLMNMLKSEIPGLLWTVDYRTARDNTGTVYTTGGSGNLNTLDMPYRYPTYQVYIRSSDWDFSQTASEFVFDTLHNKQNFQTTVDYYKGGKVLHSKDFFVFLISAMQDPIRVGENGGVMEYSINFDVVLTEIKEKGATINV